MMNLDFWKKLNYIVKTRTPYDTAREMVASGNFSEEEMSWAIAALATLPIAMLETLQEKGVSPIDKG